MRFRTALLIDMQEGDWGVDVAGSGTAFGGFLLIAVGTAGDNFHGTVDKVEEIAVDLALKILRWEALQHSAPKESQ